MPRCNGKGYEECDSCINREHDPMECDSCEDGSNYEPDEADEQSWDDANDVEEMDLSEFASRYAKDFA